ncbi:peptidoglycan recognition family protein [Sphaerisporangium sp. TRM90804]|uniref:N-acetylmuramoyl-L-alanine amidase n=1 Tax=Sphaerisporangium sp. TRM90804 TaxID=3031113 RepID=UPI00244B6126|nr:peptidoglycan recognition family protein [Sphaerisporangium sp. TRM90804]MDH2425006.1 peptidoglycan recognition family protein [Sphaerisporangium sp. TRM90804]
MTDRSGSSGDAAGLCASDAARVPERERVPMLRTRAAVATVAASLLAGLSPTLAPAHAAPVGAASRQEPSRDPATSRQQAFRDAAAEYGVPEPVLLGVSYLSSRWDANQGAPSVAAGYGPMHLTDARTALAAARPHHGAGTEDPRGDDARPAGPPAEPAPAPPTEAAQTVDEAARLTGLPAATLAADPDANVRGGAALLARYQRELGLPAGGDAGSWYGAVARYSGAEGRQAARRFADEVFTLVRSGAHRVTDDGQEVSLPPSPEIAPRMEQVDRLGLPEAAGGRNAECPRSLACEWIPAPYQKLGEPPTSYGNHDLASRPRDLKIDYIVVHDTEATYDTTLRLVSDPAYVSWHYTIRSSDGHIAQHVRHKDVAWHAGNWYINSKSIGIEHEGFLATAGRWYTEAMYRSSAALVRYLAKRYDIPLDRAHIIGHDNVPGTLPGNVAGMHVDPGPYWDWGHYFELLHRPFKPTGGPGGLVTIRTDYARHRPRYTGCQAAGTDCPPHGSASVWLHTAPAHNAPLVRDIGRRPNGESTYEVYDHGARATTGQQFALAGRRGDWTAIWYLGQLAWFHNPPGRPTAVEATGYVVTPKPGAAAIPVYGRAYPEPEAFPAGVPVQTITPLQYTIAQGQRYAAGLATRGEYYYSTTFDVATHRVVRGRLLYYQIQLGHRIAFVKAADVDLLPSAGKLH